jgi:DNA-binding HxlR family transcriptional regulator
MHDSGKIMVLKGKEYCCPVALSLDIIGGKWKPFILWHLGQHRILRFNELKRLLPSVTQKMMTQQLRELEADGMIDRKVYAQVPPKVEYSLSETGTSFMPILNMLCDWGIDYYQAVKKSG